MNIYETHHFKDPRLPFIFHNASTYLPNTCDIYGNWHENLEILLVIEGSGSITLNTTEHFVDVGDIIVVNSNILHKFAAHDITLKYHCLIVDRSFCLANCFDTNELWLCEKIRDEDIEHLMQQLSLEFSKKERMIADVLRIRAFVLEVMAILCLRHVGKRSEEHRETHLMGCLKQAIGYIRSNYTNDLSLNEVAEFAGLSKYYFAHEFRRLTDYSFVEYINILRLEKAKNLLRQSQMTIAEIGKECGFENRAYFSRSFTRYVNITPSEYRIKKLEM